MKLVVGFRLLAATIDIAALVKSVGAAYQYVGPGQCLDSSGEHYDYAYLSGQINNIDAAYNWCLSATNYKSKLVGVTIAGGIWFAVMTMALSITSKTRISDLLLQVVSAQPTLELEQL
jgi:hypothetical protein